MSSRGEFRWIVFLGRCRKVWSCRRALRLRICRFTALLALFGGVDAQREEDGAHGVVSGDPVLSVQCSKAALFVSPDPCEFDPHQLRVRLPV